METFAVKFRAGSLDLNTMVTQYDHHRKFKVEMVTDESEPILLERSVKGEWKVVQRGTRHFSEADFEELESAIEAELNKKYGVKTMLVLTDFSDAALNAARYAAALTHQLRTSKLILYHSYDIAWVPPTAFAPVGPGFTESPEVSLEKIMDMKNDLEDWVAEPTNIEIRTDERTLISAVNMLTQQEHIGLAVAGITGKSNLEKMLVGSNTVRLAKECLAPLLIVPAVATFQPIKTVVFACDLKRVSASTPVLAIKAFVHGLGARLLILNIDHDEENFDPGTINELADLHRLWDDEQPEYHYINHEDISAGIMEFAGQQRAELVIMVPKEYGFFENIFHRSMTEKLAYHTHLPLLLFKEDT
jgi:nucleotide-binding universal stress UspA family protein